MPLMHNYRQKKRKGSHGCHVGVGCLRAHPRHVQALAARLLPVHGAAVQSVQQLRPRCQGLAGVFVVEPVAITLVHLGPLGLLLLDRGLEEMIRGLWGLGGELVGLPPFGDQAEVVGDFADDASLFPGLALGSLLYRRLVELPAALGKNPSATPGGLDEEYVELVGGERNYAGNESFTLCTIACCP